MEILQRTIASLGPPIWIESLHRGLGHEALIARWRHTDARVVIPAAETIRIVLNLVSGPEVRHAERGEITSVRSVAGNISVMLPYVSSETVVSGRADVLQIFIRPETLQLRRGAPVTPAPLATLYAELKRAVLQLFVSARHPRIRPCELAESQLKRVLADLLASLSDQNSHMAHTGSGPAAVRRVDRLISRAIDRCPPVELAEMAATAGWSVPHLIRSFRRERGATPHQMILKRRLERAMDLLWQPDLSVAEIADAAGFSSPAHFGATFRQQLGVTPGAYQQALQPTG